MHYHWVNSTKKNAIKQFYEEYFDTNPAFIERNQATLIVFLLGTSQSSKRTTTKTSSQLIKDFKLKSFDQEILSVLDQIFGSQPSLANMKKLFADEAIQLLWFGHANSFKNS
mmetsp:Transcript_2709/g.4603  ORF Transcript_2709/g.4603 Transcript_2709/m.4603 type:complete len:112 (+) Transcript_2709:677-1012(+)